MFLHTTHSNRWQNQSDSSIFLGTNCTKNIGILKLLLPNYPRTSAPSCPESSNCTPLPNSCFILEPDFHIFWSNTFRQYFGYFFLEFFLKSSCAAESDFGCLDRAEIQESPHRSST